MTTAVDPLHALANKLLALAQNDHMIDQHYTETGRMLINASDVIREAAIFSPADLEKHLKDVATTL